MALIKQLTSEKSGAVVGYHVVKSVAVAGNMLTIMIASYASKDAFNTRKMPVDTSVERIGFGGGEIKPDAITFAQNELLKTDKFKGASVE